MFLNQKSKLGEKLLKEGDFPEMNFCKNFAKCAVAEELEKKAMHFNLNQLNSEVQKNYVERIKELRRENCENCRATEYFKYKRY